MAAWITIIFLLFERRSRTRPYLQISFELIRSSLACLVIRNVGECALEVSSIEFNIEFVNQLPKDVQERIFNLKTSKIKIFPKQFYVLSLDVTVGTIIQKYNVKQVVIDYIYKKLKKCSITYKEHSLIDFSQYGSMLIYISEIDELKTNVEKLLIETKDIKKIISNKKAKMEEI